MDARGGMKQYLPRGLVNSGPAFDLSVARPPRAQQLERSRTHSSQFSSQSAGAQRDLQPHQLPLLPGYQAYMKDRGDNGGASEGHEGVKIVNSSPLCVGNSAGRRRVDFVRANLGDLDTKQKRSALTITTTETTWNIRGEK